MSIQPDDDFSDMPAAAQVFIGFFCLLHFEHAIDDRMNPVYGQCTLKLLLHGAAAYIDAVDGQTLSHDGQRIDLGTSGTSHKIISSYLQCHEYYKIMGPKALKLGKNA